VARHWFAMKTAIRASRFWSPITLALISAS
jgi:hypothetical protein